MISAISEGMCSIFYPRFSDSEACKEIDCSHLSRASSLQRGQRTDGEGVHSFMKWTTARQVVRKKREVKTATHHVFGRFLLRADKR